METRSLFVAVSFEMDSGAPIYRKLIENFQNWDTPVYGNNLTHFFTRGPIDFPDVERFDRAMRHPDLIIILLSKEYYADSWLRSEMDACLQLGRHRRNEALVLIIPVNGFDSSVLPDYYRAYTKNKIELTTCSEGEIKALGAHLSKVRRAHVTNPAKHTSNKIFVVHGHDLQSTGEIEVYLREAGLEPVVLHRKADGGITTILDKFRKHADAEYAIIVLTPDDVAYARRDGETHKEFRARQNCLFEFGYFLATLGHGRICCICHEEVVLPSDIAGLLPKRFKHDIEEVRYPLLKELKEAGYVVSI